MMELRQIKDLFIFLSGFSMLVVVYFLQRPGLNIQIFFLQPLAISVLSAACYTLLIARDYFLEDDVAGLGEDYRVKEYPE